MILFLDSTNLDKIVLALIDEAGKKRPIKKTVTVPYHESHRTLEHLDNFLRANLQPTTYKLLTTIIICSGPGSFTGIRVGASLAEALGFAWNIPVRAIKKEKIPKDLRDTVKLKITKKITINYGRPAV